MIKREATFLKSIGEFAFLLYLFLFIWRVLMQFWFDNITPRKLPKKWYQFSFWQFLFGIIISISLYVLGLDVTENSSYKFYVTLFTFIGIIASWGLIVFIVLNEWEYIKDFFGTLTKKNDVQPTATK